MTSWAINQRCILVAVLVLGSLATAKVLSIPCNCAHSDKPSTNVERKK